MNQDNQDLLDLDININNNQSNIINSQPNTINTFI